VNEDRATRYHRLRRRAEALGLLVAGLLLVTLLATGWSLSIREAGSILGMIVGHGWEEAGTAAGATIGLFVLLQIVELPFAFYQGFVLEHRYGLSNERLGQWSADHAKGALLGGVFAILGASIVYWSLRVSPAWWWALSAAIFAIAMIGLAQLAPVLLLPIFYSFKPLDRPVLVERLLTLAARARTHVVGVYEWALSAHTKKANAALTGMGRTRRILLSDTLLTSYSDDEIEVVLAHELSHHVHHDLWRGMALQAALLVVTFAAAHLALGSLTVPLGLAGPDDPAGLPLLLVIGGACSLVFMPLTNGLSRAHERRADRYALAITRQPDAFISAMKRLSQQNLAEEFPSTIVRWFFYSHPPIRERVDAARAWRASEAGGGHAGVA
jgi:Zn-dependent protease with chaperone function